MCLTETEQENSSKDRPLSTHCIINSYSKCSGSHSSNLKHNRLPQLLLVAQVTDQQPTNIWTSCIKRKKKRRAQHFKSYSSVWWPAWSSLVQQGTKSQCCWKNVLSLLQVYVGWQRKRFSLHFLSGWNIGPERQHSSMHVCKRIARNKQQTAWEELQGSESITQQMEVKSKWRREHRF